MELSIKPTPKQEEAYKYLLDDSTTEILFGGSAGSAKSWLGCEYILIQALRFPDTRWLVGRKELKQLKQTTLATFWKVCKHHKIKPDMYNYNSQSGVIKLYNDSEILLAELAKRPSDEEFQNLGSLELTGAFVDEAGEIEEKAYEILKTRIGRQKNKEYGILPKILMSCNPIKNWLYFTFYKPHQENTLEERKKFIQALPQDNPYLDEHYIEALKNIKDEATKQRLLHGNWDYDDDPTALCDFDAINDLWTNVVRGGDRYITADIARYGNDKTVIYYWDGLILKDCKTIESSSLPFVKDAIREMEIQYQVPRSRVIIDEDGIGGGVLDMLSGAIGFMANRRCFEVKDLGKMVPANYQNLKTQCSYRLAEMINRREISVEPESIRELLSQELGQLKTKDADKDGKLKVIPKEEIKTNIGRSPDYLDAMIMRMFFEYKEIRKVQNIPTRNQAMNSAI